MKRLLPRRPTKPIAYAVLGLGLAVAAIVPPNFARDRKEAGSQRGEVVLRVTTRLIEINVIALDKKGQPITDLTKDDFTVLDNGKRQPISVFTLNTSEPVENVPLPPDTFTNRPERGRAGSVTVILLDGLNTSYEDQTWSRTEVVRFLQQLEPQDRVAIYMLGEHLSIAQDFSSDSRTLLAVLHDLESRPGRELAGSTTPLPSNINSTATGPSTGLEPALTQLSSNAPTGPGSAPNGAASSGAAGAAAQAQEEALFNQFIEEKTTSFFSVDRVLRTVNALIAIANHLADFPGRKNLVWVSGSFPIQIGMLTPRAPGDTRTQRQFGPEIERAGRTLNSANVAVYPVDARGLVAGGAADGATPASGRGIAGESVRDPEALFSTQGVMDAVADATGGRAFYNTSDLEHAIRRALDDSRVTYTFGFYPSNSKWDGKFHELKVKVNRPGVRLRYRLGYYATLATPASGDQGRAALSQATRSPLDATGVGLTVGVEKVPNTGNNRLKLRINVNAHDVSFQDEQNALKGATLDLLLTQLGADGKPTSNVLHTVHMGVPAKSFDQVLKRGLGLADSFDVDQGATELRLSVRDPNSGNLGSVSLPIRP